jgi:hypothetical protein
VRRARTPARKQTTTVAGAESAALVAALLEPLGALQAEKVR